MIASRSAVQKHVPGDAKARSLWAHRHATSNTFYFARVRLLSAALPAEVASIQANTVQVDASGTVDPPLVIDANAKHHGVGEFVPKAIVIAGAARRRSALERGEQFAMAWVGAKALKAMGVGTLDGVSLEELDQKLSVALHKKLVADGMQASGTVQIQQLHPFDNRVIFTLRGQTYQMPYSIDTLTRETALLGSPVKINGSDLQACGDVEGYSGAALPFIPLGVHVSTAMSLPSLFSVNPGAAGSQQRVASPMLNVDSVVATYLANVRNGYHSPILPPAAPIPAVRQLFARELRARGVVSPADFFAWVEKSIAAGGPGSGRYPAGSGGGPNKETDAPRRGDRTAAYQRYDADPHNWGFARGLQFDHENDMTDSSTFHDGKGGKVNVDSKGNWAHTDVSGKAQGSGNGHDSFHSYMDQKGVGTRFHPAQQAVGEALESRGYKAQTDVTDPESRVYSRDDNKHGFLSHDYGELHHSFAVHPDGSFRHFDLADRNKVSGNGKGVAQAHSAVDAFEGATKGNQHSVHAGGPGSGRYPAGSGGERTSYTHDHSIMDSERRWHSPSGEHEAMVGELQKRGYQEVPSNEPHRTFTNDLAHKVTLDDTGRFTHHSTELASTPRSGAGHSALKQTLDDAEHRAGRTSYTHDHSIMDSVRRYP